MRIEWSDRSTRDIEELWTYIAYDNPRAAIRQVGLINKATNKLTRFPGLGRPGRCMGTRELIIGKTPYIAMYRIKNKTIEILRVLHGSRQWPEAF